MTSAGTSLSSLVLSTSFDRNEQSVDLDVIVAHLPEAILLVEPDASLLWANPAAEELFGLTINQAAGLSGLDFIHPDDLQLAALSMSSVQDKTVGTAIEIRIRSRHGWRLVEVVGSPIGEQILLSLRDITQRRRWEVAGDEVALFRSLVQNSASLTMLVHPDGTVAGSSAAITRVLGHDPEWMQGRSLSDLVFAEDRLDLERALLAVQDPTLNTPRTHLAVQLRNLAGHPRPFALTIANLLDDPTVEGLVVSGHDITELVAAENELRAANSVLAATLEATADGIIVVDAVGCITGSNSRFAGLRLNPAAEQTEVVGSPLLDVLAGIGNRESAEARLLDILEHPELETHGVIMLTDGRSIELDSRPQRIEGVVVGRVWSFRDITEHRRLEAELTHRAFHDSLTNLPNQALFRDRLDHAITRLGRGHEQLVILFIDLDDFKTVNDTLGHPAGDDLLRAVAERLAACLRQGDTVARLGGDEFAILLEDINGDAEALEVVERIVDLLNKPVRAGQRRITTSASIGVAFGDASSECDELLRRADLAMYHAKESGKNAYRIFRSEMEDLAFDRYEIESGLHGIASRDELVVHYQPIYDLTNSRIVAMEALVRWNHPTRGLISPDQFIHLAEQAGLIHELGTHVLFTACTEAARWIEALGIEHAPAVTVNISPRQLLAAELTETVATVLRASSLPASQLILEITESALIEEPLGAVACLRRLSALGIRLAVDDFGTGYSALSYLQQFPVDILKIDRAFTAYLTTERGASLTQAIIQLAHSLNVVPVAEGVETAEHLDIIRGFGCDLAQGFHLSAPLDVHQARELLGIDSTD